MTLLALQHDFRDWLNDGRDEVAARFPASAREGLGIYQNNYRASLAACLEESFPITLAWLGGEAFHQAVVTHVESVPPSSWTLDRYPSDFPATLARLYPDDREVADLSTLELALGEAFVATGASPLSTDLAAVDWDRAKFAFIPSLTFRRLATNAPAIWSAIEAGEMPPAAALLPRPATLIVWRCGEACRFRAIDYDEKTALHYLLEEGATFGGLCGELGDANAQQVGQWLGQWLGEGLIADIRDSD